MKMKKRLLLGLAILAILAFTTPSHASGGVFGNIGIYDYPWSIAIGYNDYGHGYRRPRYVDHDHYYKPRRYHHRGHGHHKHYKRHHYRPHHDYGHRYCGH